MGLYVNVSFLLLHISITTVYNGIIQKDCIDIAKNALEISEQCID